jgi:hypothetical protein
VAPLRSTRTNSNDQNPNDRNKNYNSKQFGAFVLNFEHLFFGFVLVLRSNATSQSSIEFRYSYFGFVILILVAFVPGKKTTGKKTTGEGVSNIGKKINRY